MKCEPWGSGIGNSVLTWSHPRRICYVLGVPISPAKPSASLKRRRNVYTANTAPAAWFWRGGIG